MNLTMNNIKEYTDSIKIDDIPWSRMTTAYDTAENYPEMLKILDEMKNLDEVKNAWNEISSIEHQSTMFTPAPFALVFLVRIYEKALNSANNPVAVWIEDKLGDMFEYYKEICDDIERTEDHPNALENMYDILDSKYLLPEGVSLYAIEDENEFQMLYEKLFTPELFYSLYHYSKAVLADIQNTKESEVYRTTFHLEEYSEDIIQKVISAAMKSSSVPITDTAIELNISEKDVKKILSATSQVWNH